MARERGSPEYARPRKREGTDKIGREHVRRDADVKILFPPCVLPRVNEGKRVRRARPCGMRAPCLSRAFLGRRVYRRTDAIVGSRVEKPTA